MKRDIACTAHEPLAKFPLQEHTVFCEESAEDPNDGSTKWHDIGKIG